MSRTVTSFSKTQYKKQPKTPPCIVFNNSEYKFKNGEDSEYTTFPLQEAESVAESIGMDIYTDDKHRWFLHMILLSDLPYGWTKEFHRKGKIRYYNEVLRIKAKVHPLATLYRKIFAGILKQSDSLSANKNDNLSDGPNDSISRSMYLTALLFYEKSVGAAPAHVLEKAKYYKIKLPEESYLLWVPRMSLCLPLPPGWKEVVTSDGVQYFCKELNQGMSEHPCDKYITKLIQFLRVKKMLDPCSLPPIKTMTFYDELFRPHEYELRGARFIPKKLVAGSEKETEEVSQYEKLFNENTIWMLKYCNERPKTKKVASMKDSQILTVGQQAGLDSMKFVDIISEIITDKEVNIGEWIYKESIEVIGDGYWINKDNKAITHKYPYIDEVKERIEKARMEMNRQIEEERQRAYEAFWKNNETYKEKIQKWFAKRDKKTIEMKNEQVFINRFTEWVNFAASIINGWLEKIESWTKKMKEIFIEIILQKYQEWVGKKNTIQKEQRKVKRRVYLRLPGQRVKILPQKTCREKFENEQRTLLSILSEERKVRATQSSTRILQNKPFLENILENWTRDFSIKQPPDFYKTRFNRSESEESLKCIGKNVLIKNYIPPRHRQLIDFVKELTCTRKLCKEVPVTTLKMKQTTRSKSTATLRKRVHLNTITISHHEQKSLVMNKTQVLKPKYVQQKVPPIVKSERSFELMKPRCNHTYETLVKMAQALFIKPDEPYLYWIAQQALTRIDPFSNKTTLDEDEVAEYRRIVNNIKTNIMQSVNSTTFTEGKRIIVDHSWIPLERGKMKVYFNAKTGEMSKTFPSISDPHAYLARLRKKKKEEVIKEEDNTFNFIIK